ncbi:MAG TPA: efflux RND transporter periplasmic adaptor subunit [Steroidobacteraceae bacterium]|nr:efflux RND transporter periplasmic adaptor subunit [Steroidobacteraceae bacterium]
MKRALVIAVAAPTAIALFTLGYLAGRRITPRTLQAPGTQSGATRAANKVLYWYDPMAPGQRYDRPGPSPTMPGMQLKPKYADQAGGGGVRIDARIEQNLGVRTAIVRVAPLHSPLRVPGILAWDRRRSQVISARAAGVLAQLYVRAPFARVSAGEPLAELLAPTWNAAVAEYAALAGAHSADGRALRAAALERLHALGMSSAEIHTLATSSRGGIVLRAPIAGVISALKVRQGQRVDAGTTLMRIDDPTRLWVDAAIPQAEVAGIGPGTPAQIEVSAWPGRQIAGRVEALLPEVDARTRTQTARIALDNRGGALAPGMFATVRLAVAAGKPHPLVPDEALISSGLQNRVIVDLGNGRMAPRAVRIGRSAGGYTAVLAGLSGGERVVTSGQFLIDSEANLNGALQRLTTPPAHDTMPAPAGGETP